MKERIVEIFNHIFKEKNIKERNECVDPIRYFAENLLESLVETGIEIEKIIENEYVKKEKK